MSKDDSAMAKTVMDLMTGHFGLHNATYAAIATTESNAGFLLAHYEARANSKDGCVNAFIAKDRLVLTREQYDKARLATFVAVMMRRLASQDKTTVITAKCGDRLVKNLESLFKGIAHNLINLTKLDINGLSLPTHCAC